MCAITSRSGECRSLGCLPRLQRRDEGQRHASQRRALIPCCGHAPCSQEATKEPHNLVEKHRAHSRTAPRIPSAATCRAEARWRPAGPAGNCWHRIVAGGFWAAAANEEPGFGDPRFVVHRAGSRGGRRAARLEHRAYRTVDRRLRLASQTPSTRGVADVSALTPMARLEVASFVFAGSSPSCAPDQERARSGPSDPTRGVIPAGPCDPVHARAEASPSPHAIVPCNARALPRVRMQSDPIAFLQNPACVPPVVVVRPFPCPSASLPVSDCIPFLVVVRPSPCHAAFRPMPECALCLVIVYTGRVQSRHATHAATAHRDREAHFGQGGAMGKAFSRYVTACLAGAG
jgi:hypothetical protein